MANTAVKTNNNNQVKTDKPKKSGAGKFVAIFIVVIILAALITCFVLNVGGVRRKAAEFLMPKVNTEQEMSEQEQEQIKLDEREAEITKKEAELEQREAQMAQRDDELARAELDYSARNSNLDSREKQIDSKEQNVRSVAKIYEEMDAGVAAKILMAYSDKNEVSRIMKMLSDQQAADILSEMNTQYAAGLMHIFEDTPSEDTQDTQDTQEEQNGGDGNAG